MTDGWFLTGTDTGIGKTWATVLLMKYMQELGLNVNGMKPIASGAEYVNGQLENEDAQLIKKYSSQDIPYDWINPEVFAPAVAPHIAASEYGRKIDTENIVCKHSLLKSLSDLVLVEGVGGWRVLLADDKSLSGLVRLLSLPVILVVGLRLGCINHAILSAESIRQDGFEISGWILNEIEPDYLYKKESVTTLQRELRCPLLAEVKFQSERDINQATVDISSEFEAMIRKNL